MAFAHLHVHTEYSLLDGSNKIQEYVARVKELGMTAAAITDHGVMYGVIDFYKAANTAMIQEVLKRMGIQGHITLDSAKRLIEKIEQEALRRNRPSVIAVCSPDGNPVAVHVMDGSFLVSFDMAVKKAYTSVAVKMSTMELSRLTQPGQTFYGLGKMSDNIVIFGGGVPLKVGDTIIGGLGISGGTGEEDNSLAEYGLQVLNEVL